MFSTYALLLFTLSAVLCQKRNRFKASAQFFSCQSKVLPLGDRHHGGNSFIAQFVIQTKQDVSLAEPIFTLFVLLGVCSTQENTARLSNTMGMKDTFSLSCQRIGGKTKGENTLEPTPPLCNVCRRY